MTPPAANPRTEAMRKGRQADSARRRQRVIATLNRATANGTEITVSGIARAASVDRAFLYRHRDLLGKIHALEAAPPAADGTASPAVTCASLQADLLAAHERSVRLTARVRRLERRLSEALGEQAWHESGLGVPANIDALSQQITHLEQQTSTCASNSRNATRTSLRPGPSTGNLLGRHPRPGNQRSTGTGRRVSTLRSRALPSSADGVLLRHGQRRSHPAHGAARGAHRRPGAQRIPGHARCRPHRRSHARRSQGDRLPGRPLRRDGQGLRFHPRHQRPRCGGPGCQWRMWVASSG